MKLDFQNAVGSLVQKEVLHELEKFKDVMVFGAGESGSWVHALLESRGIKPCCFCDNYAAKWGSEKYRYGGIYREVRAW